MTFTWSRARLHWSCALQNDINMAYHTKETYKEDLQLNKMYEFTTNRLPVSKLYRHINRIQVFVNTTYYYIND